MVGQARLLLLTSHTRGGRQVRKRRRRKGNNRRRGYRLYISLSLEAALSGRREKMGREVLCCSEGWQQAIIYEMFSPFLSVLLNMGERDKSFCENENRRGGEGRTANISTRTECQMGSGEKKKKGGKQPRVLHAKCNSQR